MKNPAFLPLLAAGAMALPAIAQTTEPSEAPTAKWEPRIALEENGVRPWLTLTGEGWTRANGQEGGNANIWNMIVDLGFEIDLAKFGGPETGMIVAQVRWGEATRDEVEVITGSHNPASNIFAGDQFRVFNLYYTQSWNNEEFAIKIGQIAADDDFMGSEYSGLFLNGSFGAMPSITGTSLAKIDNSVAYAAYPVAAPGFWFNWNINEKFSWQSAVYLGAPGDDERSNHGFDWKSISDGGLLFFTEGAWNFDLAGKPSTLKLGLNLHTGDMVDYKHNTESTVYSFYLVHDFALAVDAENNTSLGAFWRLGVAPQEDAATAFIYADAGVNWFAPIASRPDDVAGAAISWTKIGGAYKDAEVLVNENEFTIELTYLAQLTSYWSLQADVQYMIDPVGSNDNALVFGLRTVFDF